LSLKLKASLIALTSLTAGCSALQPADVNGPQANRAVYPVVLPVDPKQLETSLAVWQRLSQAVNINDRSEIRLNPNTGTVESVPPNAALYLPKVGTNATMSEEELRESLRRFISEWQALIGADPVQLSLVERHDESDGTGLARYEQRPFRYPLRGPYGALRIRFGADRRVIDFSSNCLPNAERLQPAIAAIVPQLTWDDAAKRAANLSVTYTTANGQSTAFQLSSANTLEARELVVYVLAPGPQSNTPELHLAWEIGVTNAPFKTIYLDAVNGNLIASA
jgi:hypothetical protein